MELQEHIYLRSCEECGLPALTYDNHGNALCVEHATVFILAASGESNERGRTPASP